MIKYESIFIADPAASDDEIGALLKAFEEVIASGEGRILRVERWGRRRLAYRVGRHEDGNYTLLYLECAPAVVKELERRYRMNERILKYLTVRMMDNLPEVKPSDAPSAPAGRAAEGVEAE